MVKSVYRSITAAVVAGSMFGASAVSAAPVNSYSSLSPTVALSLFGSSESLAAVCGMGASVAASAAAAVTVAQAGPAQGCVLPVLDAVPVAVAPPAPVAPPVAFVPAGYSISPLLLGLGAIALGSLAYYILRDDNDKLGFTIFRPAPPPPISPA